MKRNILIKTEYDGTFFHGWQRQPEVLTVQGMLEDAVSLVCGEKILINGTSRTDAGVHAYGQCASFKGNFGIPADRIPYAVNNALKSEKYGKAAGAVQILSAEDKPDEFHARFDSRGKKYIYRILNTDNISVFDRNYFYHVRDRLDTDAMRKAAEYIVGTHDFKCFEAAGGQERETTVRTIFSLEITEQCEEVAIEICGDGFLYNMVRIITGTLVEAGTGKISPCELEMIIAGRDRTKAGHTAPPQGLYLAEVYY